MIASTNIWQWISAGFAVIAVASLCTAFIFWRRSRNPTRERFAFWSVGAIIAFTISCVAMLLGHQLPFVPIMNAIAKALGFGFEIENTAPTFTEYAFVVLVVFLLVRMVLQVHANWTGPVSVADHERQQRSLNNGILIGAVQELNRRVHRLPVITWNSSHATNDENALSDAKDSMAWYEQAAELLLLSSSSYHIDLRNGWRDKPGVWLGTSMNGDVQLALIPTQAETSKDTIKGVIDWITQNSGGIPVAIHIAVRGSTCAHLSELKQSNTLHSESDLLSNLVNWTDYRTSIVQRFTKDLLPESHHSLADAYVHPKVQNGDRASVAVDLENELESWLNENSGRQLALLGEYGMGKSTSALAITHRLLSQAKPIRIPLLIELRGKSPRNQQPLEILGAWSAPFRISARALMRLHSAGRLLLIFEGFDEMALIGDAEMRIKHFTSIWSFCFPGAKILITGRPNFFLDQAELKRSLGIGRPDGNRAYCEALRLCPFEIGQVESALQCQNKQVRLQILAVARRNHRFLELISRPSILHVAASLWEKERLLEKADRLTAADLMDLFVRSSYRRQGMKEDTLSSEFMALTEREREYFMSGVAAYMMQTQLPNQISVRELDVLIETLISKMPESVTMEGGAMSNHAKRPLSIRVSESEYGLDHVKTDVRTCGLLVDDPSSPGTFRFGHKSILEFLFASLWHQTTLRENTSISHSLRIALGLSLNRLTRSQEATRFFGELLIASVEGEGIKNTCSILNVNDQVWTEVTRRVFALWNTSQIVIKVSQAYFFLIEATFRSMPKFLGGGRSPLRNFMCAAAESGNEDELQDQLHKGLFSTFRMMGMFTAAAITLPSTYFLIYKVGGLSLHTNTSGSTINHTSVILVSSLAILSTATVAASMLVSTGCTFVIRLAAAIGVPIHIIEAVVLGPMSRFLPKLSAAAKSSPGS